MRRSTMYLNGNECNFWKIVKKSGMNVWSWNFFYVKIQRSSKREKKFQLRTSIFDFFTIFQKLELKFFSTFRQGLYLDVEKFQLYTSIPDFFAIFQKLRSFTFKYMVERRIVSWSSAFARWLKISTFWPCVLCCLVWCGPWLHART